eukprot:3048480-Pyramimonas_sp.AAC.1
MWALFVQPAGATDYIVAAMHHRRPATSLLAPVPTSSSSPITSAPSSACASCRSAILRGTGNYASSC